MCSRFSVVYIKRDSKVTIRLAAHADDVWDMVTSKAEAVTLWCDRVVQKEDSSGNESDHDDDVQPKPKKKKLCALEKKIEHVENLVQKLRN